MKIYIFRSHKKPYIFGFTADGAGDNLPVDLGPWAPSGGGGIETGSDLNTLAGTTSSGSVAAAIQKNGFYIASSEILSRNVNI